MTLEENLEAYIQLSKDLCKLCLLRKNTFGSQEWTDVSTSGPFSITIYFEDNWREWAVKCDDLEYAHTGEKTINMPVWAVHDPQYMMEVVTTMRTVVSDFDVLFPPQRRKLNLIKN